MRTDKPWSKVVWAGITLAGSVLASSAAFGWGSATHAHIDDVLAKGRSPWTPSSLQAMYGGMAPDVFNYIFDRPACMAPLYARTHFQGGYLELYDLMEGQREKSLGYGFVSHNNDWAADLTAHGPLADPLQGYVIEKAVQLEGRLHLSSLFGDQVALTLSHTFVEYGIDILMRDLDAGIGRKVAVAAIYRDASFPEKLAEAYGNDMAACGVPATRAEAQIRLDEARFRAGLAAYGAALDSADDAVVLAEVSRQLASLASAYLAAYGLSLPPGMDPVATAQMGIGAAMQLCASDYRDAVKDTIRLVDRQMSDFLPQRKGR